MNKVTVKIDGMNLYTGDTLKTISICASGIEIDLSVFDLF